MKKALVAAAMLFPLPAAALTGNALLESCESSSPLFQATCDGYIWGNAEGVATMNSNDGKLGTGIPKLICTPNGVSPKQVIDVVKRYLHNHPESLHESVSVLTFYALAESFRCPE